MTEDLNEGWPRKFSLVDRSGMTFKSFLVSQYGNRFYQETFLQGIAQRRIEVNGRVGRAVSGMLAMSIIMALFDLISGTIEFSGISIRVTEDLVPVLSALVSSTVLAAAFSFVDDLLIQRYINEIGRNINVYSFQTLLVDKMAVNLWAEAIVPRYFGERSRTLQKLVMMLQLVWGMAAMAMMYCLPIFLVVRSAYAVFTSENQRFISYFLSVYSMVIIIWALVFIISFTVKFRFDRADFNEHDHEPTPEFVAEMQKQVAQGENSDS